MFILIVSKEITSRNKGLKMKKLSFIFLSLLMLIGCTQSEDQNNAREERLKTLEDQVSQLEKKLKDVNLRVLYMELDERYLPWAIFNPEVKNDYAKTIITENGHLFLVALVSLEKYANGYKANFSIGNPSAVEFEGIGIIVGTGPLKPKLAEKKPPIKINKSILPGSWSEVSVIIFPEAEDDAKLLYFSIVDEGGMSLKKDYRESKD